MILYKYYAPNEYAFKSIAVNGLWCHNPKKMNDPFECLWRAHRIYKKSDILEFKKEIEKNKSSLNTKFLQMDDIMIVAIFDKFREKLINEFSFCALSETYNNILMWSHYSKSHSGFVLGIEFGEMDHHFQKVRYLSKLPNFSAKKFAKLYLNADEKPDYMLKDLSIKSRDWSYEKEWRIWRGKPGYIKYDSKQIKEIYFGINCSIETKALVYRLATPDDPDFKFFEMEFRDNPVRLEY